MPKTDADQSLMEEPPSKKARSSTSTMFMSILNEQEQRSTSAGDSIEKVIFLSII